MIKDNLIDIHAHLETRRFSKDIDKVIERAKKANVKIIINSGVNPETNRKSLDLAKKYDIVKVSFGLYPLDALEKEIEQSEKVNNENSFPRDISPFNVRKVNSSLQAGDSCKQLSFSEHPENPKQTAPFKVRCNQGFLDINKELEYLKKNKDKFVAIGEIGLDYNWPEYQTDKIKEEQKENFRKILKVAKELDFPVIIHSRKAESDAIEILEELKMKKVIMHCFSGKVSLIKRAADNGWFFSIPPIITRLQHFQTLVSAVPLNQLLTETDSPYLSPVAGERNEPANVRFTIKEIAKIKNISEKEVADAIWENSKRLFKF